MLLQYYIDSDGALELVSREQHSLRIILLRWNEMMEEIYGANADSVSKPCCIATKQEVVVCIYIL